MLNWYYTTVQGAYLFSRIYVLWRVFRYVKPLVQKGARAALPVERRTW